MMQITKSSLTKAKVAPLYNSYSLYPGNILIEKWRESKARACSDLESIRESSPELYAKLRKEIAACNTPQDWVSYLSHYIVSLFEV